MDQATSAARCRSDGWCASAAIRDISHPAMAIGNRLLGLGGNRCKETRPVHRSTQAALVTSPELYNSKYTSDPCGGVSDRCRNKYKRH